MFPQGAQPSMAMEDKHNLKDDREFQPLLVFGPPTIFPIFEAQNSHNYRFLKAYSSQVPLHQFLTEQKVDPSSIQAILCNPVQKVSADAIRLLPSLRIIVTTSAGTDHIDLVECSRHSIQVASTAGDHAGDVADMAVGLLLDVVCKISAADRHVRKRGPSMPLNLSFGFKLKGKRVGIVGLGKIGTAVAERLEAFGCSMMYNSRKEKAFISYPFYSNVVELAGDSDVLVLCCSLNEETRHIVNREVMLALGKDGFIVNVGRGGLIDEKELMQCLMEGEIGGAGLDVFENEPIVPTDLFSLDNVVLSPHNSSFTSDLFHESCKLAAETLQVFFSSSS
ncbi:glyoxylate/hydroxypyruvate reductase HPR3 isoform X3 [Vigna angularis]|uniref:glyoxylate/hydroxypyruvate reductase HPR3 isoform X3 n=1 Tax=Phaseolus angularis TaxID=3914 RepID=UPI000809E9C1|nr:glyoxylate/hydroxypyruvate reductase HPR3 isoform X3 [Vigna angularis]